MTNSKHLRSFLSQPAFFRCLIVIPCSPTSCCSTVFQGLCRSMMITHDCIDNNIFRTNCAAPYLLHHTPSHQSCAIYPPTLSPANIVYSGHHVSPEKLPLNVSNSSGILRAAIEGKGPRHCRFEPRGSQSFISETYLQLRSIHLILS